ncbi:MAG: SPOR domain-containing protein [Pseudomonadota bacterium]|nr:SPOR domain-containing protein [Pseudomonadota bacterium]
MHRQLLHTAPRRQQGNTLTGMIIGLIIGLAIAVAVALAITKGATPFTDKSAKPAKLEPTAGQVSDPNKPLYGSKEAAREANRQLADKPKKPEADPLAAVIATMKDPADLKAEGKKPAAPATAPAHTPAAEAPAAHELARVVTAKTEPAAGDDKVIYFLQAGAFREVADAETTRAKLALLGFEAAISDRVSDAGVLHRVRIGPYSQVEAMNRARAKLIDSGIDVAIVRNQK